MKVLLYGKTGWIGGKLIELLTQLNIDLYVSLVRLDHYQNVITELDSINPTHVLVAAGLTGRPNVDWCEDHKLETIRTNILGISVLADECHKRNIHFTTIATGCIYSYDSSHPIPSPSWNGLGFPGFTESDKPNFDGSFYSYGKIISENILKQYDNCLILRIRMPISDDLSPRNFITKISKYDKIVNIHNSMSILSDLLPLIPDMMSKKLVGIFNFVNPGVISHNEILDLYIKYIDPSFTYTNFTLDEQSKVIKAPRSNNSLDSSKLLSYYPSIPHIQDSIHNVFKRMQSTL